MNILVLTCIDIEKHEDFSVVNFQVSSGDATIYASGNFGIQIDDGSRFAAGENYNLNLNKVG